jgi:hypothetical protein
VTRRLLPVAFALVLVACAQDDPTIDAQPEQPAEEQPAEEQPAVAPGDEIVVTAVEYEFQGVPDTLAEGEYSFTLQNDGEEKHELYLSHITGPQSIEEILELPEQEVSKLTQAVDRVVAPTPDQPASFIAALVPGRFGYVCFISAPDGTPHAFLGMAGEFTVA